jgi:hypothetical protein
MTDARLRWRGSNDDGDITAADALRKLREGAVIEVSGPSGTHTIRRNPLGEYNGRHEFTDLHKGTGGGFCGRYGIEAAVVSRIFERADRGFRCNTPAKLWPDEADAVPEAKWGGPQ